MPSNPFERLKLIEPLLRAIEEEGYEEPTQVQRAAIPELLAGKDLLATAQTGTGKTASFALPMLQLLQERPRPDNAPDVPPVPRSRRRGRRARGRRASGGAEGVRALILAPTRELALQVEESFRAYGRHLPLRTAVVLGGVPSRSQIAALAQNPEILVATPGRLIDLHNQRLVRLDQVEMLVLDEADRMLDMGFVHDVRRIVALTPASRQTMFFSATLSGEVGRLASDMLRDPATVAVTPPASVSNDIEQKVLFVQRIHKRALLANVLEDETIERALVFTRTKVEAEYVSQLLSHRGVSADAIHSNKNQKERQRALGKFDCGDVRVLVATDIVARGIDVDGITHVINYEMPNEPENYVHRIGRTARAGALGTALSFCDAGEVAILEGIEKLTGKQLTTFEDHPYHSNFVAGLCKRNSSPTRFANGSRRKFRSRNRANRRYV